MRRIALVVAPLALAGLAAWWATSRTLDAKVEEGRTTDVDVLLTRR